MAKEDSKGGDWDDGDTTSEGDPVQVEPETACEMGICDFCQQPMEIPKGKPTRDSKMCPSCETSGIKSGLQSSGGQQT
jgi:hypothetical protein